MSKNNFCKKRKFTQSIKETQHNLCQLYNVQVNFDTSQVSVNFENYSHQRKQKTQTNYSNIFWSGADEEESPMPNHSLIVGHQFQLDSGNSSPYHHQEIYYEKQWNGKWDQGETLEGQRVEQ